MDCTDCTNCEDCKYCEDLTGKTGWINNKPPEYFFYNMINGICR